MSELPSCSHALAEHFGATPDLAAVWFPVEDPTLFSDRFKRESPMPPCDGVKYRDDEYLVNVYAEYLHCAQEHYYVSNFGRVIVVTETFKNEAISQTTTEFIPARHRLTDEIISYMKIFKMFTLIMPMLETYQKNWGAVHNS